MATYTSPNGTPFVGFYLDEHGLARDSRTGRALAPINGVGGVRPDSGGIGLTMPASPFSQFGGVDGLNLPESPTLPGGITVNPIPSRNIPNTLPSFSPAVPPSQGASQGVGTARPDTGGGLGDKLKDFLTDPKNLVGLAGVIAALAGGAGGGNGQASAESQRMNAITEQRMKRVDPLHQAMTQLAWGRLPVSSRNGIAPPTYKPLP